MRMIAALLPLPMAAMALALARPARADTVAWRVDEPASTLDFIAVGKPGFLRINGKGATVSGTSVASGDGLSGAFDAKLDGFTTGIDMRDEHMKTKYLETGKFPKASLKWSLPGGVAASAGEAPFKGRLTLHGVEKEVSGTAKVVPAADKKSADVEATLPIKLSEFGIDIPKYLGITVAEDVEVKAHLHVLAGP